MTEGRGRVGTVEGAADQYLGPRRSGAARSMEADHALRLDARGLPGYRLVDRGPGGQEPLTSTWSTKITWTGSSRSDP